MRGSSQGIAWRTVWTVDIKGEDIQERQFFLGTAAVLAVICWSEILAICSAGNRLSTYTIALQNTSMVTGIAHKGVSVILNRTL